ncbi:hypothetical protein MNBD_GAMMA12-3110 [hydrothermal vent metagenome]|uniref:IncF plasmid conjugative transfer pilus assembly protein TraF n=1 Tax=hydrothermal vent metagenome TaxID=652676 RepID=A0A3B0YQ60_9ZZZZ
MKYNISIFVVISSLGFCASLYSQSGVLDSRNTDNFFNNRQEGYFWYLDPMPEKKQKEVKKEPSLKKSLSKKKPKVTTLKKLKNLSAERELKEFQRRLESAKARAIMRPTRQNIRVYLYLQKEAMAKASIFADQWRRVVWQTPQLNYSLKRPTTNAALHTYKDNRLKQVVDVSKAIGKEYGIYFFFKGSCPYCHRFAPSLKLYQKNHGLKVLPISLDGGVLPDYPNPKVDTRVARMLNVTRVPAVYLVHLKTGKKVAVTLGLISYAELQNRVYILTKTRPGQEF